MGLYVSLFHNFLEGSLTGPAPSLHLSSVCVVNAEGPFTPDGRHPPYVVCSHVNGCAALFPARMNDAGDWVAVSGHHANSGVLAASSDGRFTDAVERAIGHRFYGGIYVHDWTE